jgi:hypothetical protein
MTRLHLAVAVHSLYNSIHSRENHFFDLNLPIMGNMWEEWFVSAEFIDYKSQDIKSIRTLRTMPLGHLFRHVKAIMTGLAIDLDGGYLGFSGLESAVSDLAITANWDEILELLGWFNGVVPSRFQLINDDHFTH